MKKFISYVGLFALLLSVEAAENKPASYPLYFKTLDPVTAFYSPQGYCTVVILSETKPEEIIKEPEAPSKKLYARLFSSERPVVLGDNFPTPPTMAVWGQPIMTMRLTEKEEGEGYDTAIIDLNNNGDLTDDPVFRDHKVAKHRKFFGPFQLPLPEGTLATNSQIKPMMYLETGFLTAPRSYMNPKTGKFTDFVGFAAVRSGWVLEGRIDHENTLQTIAFKDAYCDFTFSQSVSHREILNDDLYFENAKKVSSIEFFPSDYVLRDYNNNGRYDCELPLNEAEAFGKYILLDGKLYQWSLSKDLTSYSLSPVTDSSSTGTFALPKTSDKRIQVALMTGYTPPEKKEGPSFGDDKWQLITINAENIQSQLPVGSYLLSQFALRSRDTTNLIAHFPLDTFSSRESISFNISPEQTFKAPWGEPLNLTLEVFYPQEEEFESTLQIYINLVGNNGETYSDFSVFSPKTRAITRMNGPRVEILCEGKPVGSHVFSNDFLGWWWQIPEQLKGKKVLLVPVFNECPVHVQSLEIQL